MSDDKNLLRPETALPAAPVVVDLQRIDALARGEATSSGRVLAEKDRLVLRRIHDELCLRLHEDGQRRPTATASPDEAPPELCNERCQRPWGEWFTCTLPKGHADHGDGAWPTWARKPGADVCPEAETADHFRRLLRLLANADNTARVILDRIEEGQVRERATATGAGQRIRAEVMGLRAALAEALGAWERLDDLRVDEARRAGLATLLRLTKEGT